MLDKAKELVAGKNDRDLRHARHSYYLVGPMSNGVIERLVGIETNGTRAMLRDSWFPPRFCFWAEAMSSLTLSAFSNFSLNHLYSHQGKDSKPC